MNAHRSEKEATKLGSLAMADEGISYREYDVSTTKTIENMIVGNGNEEFEPEHVCTFRKWAKSQSAFPVSRFLREESVL